MYNLLLRNLYRFKGRSSRKEYIARLLLITIFICIRIFYIDKYRHVDVHPLFSILNIITALFLLIYMINYIPLAIRRLHDIGYSGWCFLVFSLAHPIMMLILMFTPGTEEVNKYGEPPIN
jgi:uncharacterized membrane protein YhaH (DUF805 family)